MLKKEKGAQSTVRSLELPNNRSWVDFLDKESLSLYSSKHEWRERLMHTMLQWSDKSTSLEIMQFCIEYKIPYRTLKEWIDKYPEIKSTYDDVKLVVASRRRVGTMNKKYY